MAKRKTAKKDDTDTITIRFNKSELDVLDSFATRIRVPVEHVIMVFLGLGIRKATGEKHALQMAALLSNCQDAFIEKWHPTKVKALNAAIGAQLKSYKEDTARE